MTVADATQYIVNPDVSCREEGPDGAILFNPDSDQVLLINPTGLVIWRALAQPRTTAGIVAFVLEWCDNVPEGQVHQDAMDFVADLVAKGFVGAWQEG